MNLLRLTRHERWPVATTSVLAAGYAPSASSFTPTVDHLHLVIVPIVLGRGQRLWDGLEGFEARFDIQIVPGDGHVTHLIATRANNHEGLGGHHA
jgi:dihydrofolate reductase